MTHTIRLQPSGVEYQASANTTLLDSALTQELPLHHGCRQGHCGTCAALLVTGIVKNKHGETLLPGPVLTCCTYPHSDVCLKADYVPELVGIRCLTLPCKVDKMVFCTSDIMILTLRLPPTQPLHYLPGQYIDLIYQGVKRSYSMANMPSNTAGIELHIRLLADGEFSRLLTNASVNTLMRLEGPKGTFFVRSSNQPLVFLAGGTGFAPIKAMVQALLDSGSTQAIHIYWGVSREEDLYLNIASDWASQYTHVRYVPVVSHPSATWAGRAGSVYQAILEDIPDLQAYQIYACGGLKLLQAAREALIHQGLEPEHFYSDAFVPS